MISKRVVVATAAAAATTAVVVTAVKKRELVSGHRATMRSVTVDRPARLVYAFWRDLPRLAGALDRPAEVEVIDETTSRWTVHGPMGAPLHWTAEITEDRPDNTLAWRVSDGLLPHEGRLDLVEAPGGRGTELHLSLRYELPGGPIAAAMTKLTGDEPDQVLRTCLRRIKQLLECGQIVTTDGQPSGRGPVRERVTRFVQHKLVTGGRP